MPPTTFSSHWPHGDHHGCCGGMCVVSRAERANSLGAIHKFLDRKWHAHASFWLFGAVQAVFATNCNIIRARHGNAVTVIVVSTHCIAL